ncbi:hypothetical protein QAD02_000627 [Eretmocerus hayati]|uniref:Uncharacterized protein n=1 Tax=Eretmocerus hayati TaxID=131215 RepID=A0ACC2NDZ9_9HYME|nr:hypothetical protein QAD02_000627 [Eretmocerus hayati]
MGEKCDHSGPYVIKVSGTVQSDASESSQNVATHDRSNTQQNNADNTAKPTAPPLNQILLKPSKEMAKVKKRICFMIIAALICVATGIYGIILWPGFFHSILTNQLVLSPTSMSHLMWRKTPVPMYLKIYLYNWTNSEDLSKSNVKPHFQQMGPYVFREVDTKVNQIWDEYLTTLTYQQKREWYFEPEMSNGTLKDKVTNLNPISATIGYMVRSNSTVRKWIANNLLKYSEKITITKTVKQLLFDGYDDILLDLAAKVKFDLPFEKFAWFYARNGSETYDGLFSIFTGSDDFNSLGFLKEWNHDSVSPKFSKTCGRIKGTVGDLWPPLTYNDTISVFSPDVCTTISLKEDGTSEWLGVTGKRFSSDPSMFDNGTEVPSRKCYCQSVECQPSGTLNVSNCKFGAPAFVSLPHFYLADKSYRQKIDGMNPNKEDHQFTLLIEPDTGIPIQVRAALQINFLVRPYDGLSYFDKFSEMYVPMLWFTQDVNLTSDVVSQVKLLKILPTAGNGLLGFIIGIGVFLVVLSGIMYFRQKVRDEQNDILIPKDGRRRDGGIDVADINEE